METRELSRGIIYSTNKNSNLLFLIIKAKKGYWQFPQGGIDDNETPIQCLKREILEETGLKDIEIDQNSHFLIEYDTERKGKPIHTKLHSFLTKTKYYNDITLSKEDGHTNFKWVNKEEIKNYLTKYPEQLLVFNNLIKSLNLSQNL